MGRKIPGAILQLFWEKPPQSKHQPNAMTEFWKIGAKFFDLTDEKSAEVAIFPIWLEQTHKRKIKVIADKIGLKLVVFSHGDDANPMHIDNTITFKHSYHRSWQHKHPNRPVLGFPAWSGDLLLTYFDGLCPLAKSPKPKIGFCGFKSHIPMRHEAIKHLIRSDAVITDFIINKEFFNGIQKSNTAGLMAARKNFTQNIINNHYTICVRGSGNFSYRLYETLNCGRIPIFVDTGCILPASTLVDWKKYCVWVHSKDLPNIGKIVADHYNSYNPEEFMCLQQECRIFWKQYLSPEGFFSHFADIIRPHL